MGEQIVLLVGLNMADVGVKNKYIGESIRTYADSAQAILKQCRIKTLDLVLKGIGRNIIKKKPHHNLSTSLLRDTKPERSSSKAYNI